MISNDDSTDFVREAYVALDEKHKKHIFKTVARTEKENGFMEAFAVFANIKGFQIKSLANRPAPLRGRLDQTLLDPDGEDFMLDFFACFFESPEWTDALDNVVTPRELDECLQSMNSPYEELLRAMIRCDAYRRPGYLAFPPPMENLARSLFDLHLASLSFDLSAMMIEAGSPPEERMVLDQLKKSYSAAESMRAQLRAACEMLGRDTDIPSWESREDMASYINEISNELIDRIERQAGMRGYLKGLAECVERIAVVHRSARRAQELEGLREQAASELRAASEKEDASWPLNNEKSPDDWLVEISALRGNELDRLADDLRNADYQALAAFIEEMDPAWIASESASKKPSLPNSVSASRGESELAAVRERMKELEGQLREAENHKDTRAAEAEHLRRVLDSEQDRLRALEEENRALRNMKPPSGGEKTASPSTEPEPASVAEALAAAREKFADRLIFAFNSKSEEEKNPYGKPAEVLRAMDWLAGAYYQARTGEQSCPQLHEHIRKTMPGWFYSARQSEVTLGRDIEWYTCELDGRKYTIEEHIGSGVSGDPRRCIRIAFAWDPRIRRVVVGYIGQHQRNTKS